MSVIYVPGTTNALEQADECDIRPLYNVYVKGEWH